MDVHPNIQRAMITDMRQGTHTLDLARLRKEVFQKGVFRNEKKVRVVIE